MNESEVQRGDIASASGDLLAYEHLEGRGPGIVFCPGFNSDMRGTKAEALLRWCRERGRACLRFDYRGHGESGGRFEDCTLGDWYADLLQILATVAGGPRVLVGSSMGGWLALLAARARPQQVVALQLIAPAPNFTERLLQRLSDIQRASLRVSGHCEVASEYDSEPYRISQALIEESRRHYLDSPRIDITAPVRIIHGQLDETVPWQVSLNLAEQLRSDDIELQLVKSGDHRLSEAEDIVRMLTQLELLLDSLGECPG